MLTRNFYLRDGRRVAQELLGKMLVHSTPRGIRAGIIVETEAYLGPEDAAAHSYENKRTERTEILFGTGGFAYVYLIYGMYHCLNVVTNVADKPEAVLIRALEPVEGIDAMFDNRNCEDVRLLCSGPGRLCQALEIDLSLNGADLCDKTLYLSECRNFKPEQIAVSPRINIDYAGEYRDCLWRYYVKNNPFVSKVPTRKRQS